ncbi:SulP family inorganic anion transporter [Granulosicoccus antarcticus]|uniref:SulP family inorganic anion transporter n=1 Tax=Granulosicoccus antarcticus TaxID=437505 RepID=UPI00197AA513|nr:SulP family inorganic anion transporter [Granulosicoccus antarcticus]
MELFTPKLITILRERYGLSHFRSDLLAGLTVAIVALPLSMAIAIASGASPAQGLYTAIIGGFLVSALGGSRFQIGGPAGAFIVLVASTVQLHGMEGLFLATIMSGILLMLAGYLQLGSYIKFIPYPVTIGFTAGIAVIIFASQVKDLLGLTLSGPEPGALLEKLPVIWQALPTWDLPTVIVAFVTIAIIASLKIYRPHWPGMLFAIVITSIAVTILKLPLSTIGTAFGGIPNTLPMPSLPEVSFAKVGALLPVALSFTLLGSIESLLSAVVADGMTGRRHRSNCELVAQGVANIASGLFGGICVTGTIARTATNVRAGAHGPVAGILHSVFLLLFIVLAAPVASYIPLASLAGVLAIVAWNMIEKHAIALLLRASRGDAAVLMATLLLTIFRDLMEAIVVGFALGSVLFIHRMSKTTAVSTHRPWVEDDQPDKVDGSRLPYDESIASNPDVLIYRISGVLFFGAAASVGSVLDNISDSCKLLVVDFTEVPFIDSTGANTLEGLAHKGRQRELQVVFTGLPEELREKLRSYGISEPLVAFAGTIDEALQQHGASTV